MNIHGIHHVSLIVGHAQRNLDFYAGVLGLKLVKQTLNYEDKDNYHLYFGDRYGQTPLTTTFPIINGIEGHSGAGQTDTIIYGIPKNSFHFWETRLQNFGLMPYYYSRFGMQRLAFSDPDGIELELIEVDDVDSDAWSFNGVPAQHAILRIVGAILFSNQSCQTLDLLEQFLDYTLVDEDDEFVMLQSKHDFIQVNKHILSRGRSGIGSIHHIAFSVKDSDIEVIHKRLISEGFEPSDIKNRLYFKSLYFREPGGILFEIATESPGLTVDEDREHLGTHFIIPHHFQHDTDKILEHMMPLHVRHVDALRDYGYRNRFEYEYLLEKRELKSSIQALLRKAKTSHLTPKEVHTLKVLRTQLMTYRKEHEK